ncbi:MAG: electron transport complex subunit RsxA [Clostridia bacterium]
MSEYFVIIFGSIFISNIVLVQFLGICSFLGVSKDIKSALGMGGAVTFVMALASAISWLVYQYLLVRFHLEFLQTIAFILTIASLVQFVEMFLKKFMPPLYKAMGIYLPLITTNCAILGIAILNITKNFTLMQSVTNGIANALGYTLALVLLSGIRERLELSNIPKAFQGVPIYLITASCMSMAFIGFTGLV